MTEAALLAYIQRLRESGNTLPWQVACYVHPLDCPWLDVGAGYGATHRGMDRSGTVVVESYPGAVEALGEIGFADVLPGDAREIVPQLLLSGERFVRVTAFDFLEHLPKADALVLLGQLEQLAVGEIVLFLPIETSELVESEEYRLYMQAAGDAYPAGQRELLQHRSRWTVEELQERGYQVVLLEGYHGPGFDALVAGRYSNARECQRARRQIEAWAQTLEPGRYGYCASPDISPLYLTGSDRIFVGKRVSIGYGARLEAIKSYQGREYRGQIIIEDGTSAEMFLHVGAAEQVHIGPDVMIGGHVTIVDHDHGFADRSRPPRYQPLTVSPVTIGAGAWIGEYAFIGKGVEVGPGAVIGAHAVVVDDVPAYTIVAGNPARPIGQREPINALTSIIIPTCAGYAELERCLISINKHTWLPYEVIVIDNGSPEPVETMIAWDASQDVTVLRNESNLGFAAAVNRGLAQARGAYLCVLNDDTEVQAGWLDRLLGTLQSYPEVGMVGPMSDYVSGPQLVPAAYEPEPHWGQSEETDRLVGFCWVLRREAYKQTGPLDERFFANYEDDDYCRRLRRAGWKLRMVRDVFVHHEGSRTFARLGLDLDASLAQSRDLFARKWGLGEVPVG